MSVNNLAPCARRGGIFRRWNLKTNRPEIKAVGFPCGKKTCPYCRKRRRNYLLKRLGAVPFSKNVVFWTITTDPKVLNPLDALKTMNRRWHIVHRSISRLAPNFRYFRVIEFTESGLPHMHFITDCYIDWFEFQRILIRHKFGKVLHYKLLPSSVAVRYATKYISKAVYNLEYPSDFTGRLWSSSFGLLPLITYHDSAGSWELLWIDHVGDHLLDMEKAYRLHEADASPPEFPWNYKLA